MPPTRRFLRFVAVASFIIGAGCLALCIKSYIKGSFLKAGAPIDPSPTVIEDLRKMIRSGFFWIIPGMSVLLLINSHLMWSASKRFDSDKQDKT
jgi:hypothetical protein